jgi:hypothetical protein
MDSQKIWLLYDGRYRTEEDGMCYEVCETLKEAKVSAKDYGNDTVIVEAERKDMMIVNCRIVN